MILCGLALVPLGVLLKSKGGAQDGFLVKGFASDLEADGEIMTKSARNGYSGKAGQVQRNRCDIG